MPITIDSYLPAVFGSKFRLRSKEDMRRLLNMWHLPEKVYLDDGSVVSGEYVLLFSIRRLATHTNLDDFALHEFGREYSVLSRVFKYFVMHTYHTFREKLTNNIRFFVDKFPQYAEAIRKKNECEGRGNCRSRRFFYRFIYRLQNHTSSSDWRWSCRSWWSWSTQK